MSRTVNLTPIFPNDIPKKNPRQTGTKRKHTRGNKNTKSERLASTSGRQELTTENDMKVINLSNFHCETH